MSATVETPLVPGPIQGPTREEPQIEALLLGDYASLVHLAYLILPPSISRSRRIAAAHAVVHRALPPGLELPSGDPREYLRRRVVQEAGRQAARQSLLGRLGGLFAPPDSLDFVPCATTIDGATLRQRNRRGRRIAVAITLPLTLTILVTLLTS